MCDEARVAALAAPRAAVTSRASSSDRAAATGAQPGDRLEQLRLSVALDARDAEDLARAPR